MIDRIVIAVLFLSVVLFIGCQEEGALISPLGEMIIPEDNPQSVEKIELGRKLFFDKRLSSDQSVSCASCHIPELAFTDGRQFGEGVAGHKSLRNVPSILNSGYLETIMFDAEIVSLEMQAIVPIQDTNEMAMLMPFLIKRLAGIGEYQKAAKEIFNRDFDPFVLTRSLSAFQRSLISDNSRFDQAERGDLVRTKSEERGWKLFSETLYCTKCHPAPHFTTFKPSNNGLYQNYGEDKGRFRINFDSTEIGYFKIPSLRNIELTAPYMHDGSMKTLNEILDHYQSGGKKSVNQSAVIQPFKLNDQDRGDLKEFLNSLTDTSYLKYFRY